MIARVLCANSSRANPIVFDVDTHLQDDLNSCLATDVVTIDCNAAFFPSVDHLILTEPLVSIHDTIMWLLVQVDDVLEADVEAFVVAAQT